MEWKSTNISKNDFEKKQKEYMREAMDMLKRAKPADTPTTVPEKSSPVAEEIKEAELTGTNTSAEEVSAVAENEEVQAVTDETAEETVQADEETQEEDTTVSTEKTEEVTVEVSVELSETVEVSSDMEKTADDNEEFNAEDYRQIFKDEKTEPTDNDKSSESCEHKVPDFNTYIKNHNSSADCSCESCRESRQHEEGG